MYDEQFQRRIAEQSRAEGLARELLDVQPGASDLELKHAWRRQCMACHPDRRPDDPAAPARFKLIQQAYQCLRNGERCESLLAEYEQVHGEPGEKPNHWKYFLSWRDRFF